MCFLTAIRLLIAEVTECYESFILCNGIVKPGKLGRHAEDL